MEKIMLFVKHNLGFIWDIVEVVNGWLFGLRYGRKLKALKEVAETDKNGFSYRPLSEADVPALARFFSEQPEKQFVFFKPHGFDEKSLKKMAKNKAFLMFGTFDGDRLIGYYFLRCFFIGKAFRGKIVDLEYQGKGISKYMAKMTTKDCEAMRIRQFETVSEDNIASIQPSKAVNSVLSTKKLKDGYLCVEYGAYNTLKHNGIGGGRTVVINLPVMLQAQYRLSYAA